MKMLTVEVVIEVDDEKATDEEIRQEVLDALYNQDEYNDQAMQAWESFEVNV